MKNNQKIWFLLATTVALAATCYFFRAILRDPSHVVHELGGDGVKNYYSYLYHSLYGNGWWFTGMNYPYGEHIMFVDGQPLLTLTLGWLRPWFDFSPETLNAILNILMALGFCLAVVYVFKILARFGVPAFWAMLFAPLIVMASVQNFRSFGLYGLSYMCVAPMTFYWLARYHENGRKKYMLYLLLLACTVMFLHPYQFALILVGSVLYMVAYWLTAPGIRKQKLRHILPVLVAIVSAFIVLKSVVALTDPVTDRPQYPFGLLTSGIRVVDVFTFAYSPYWIWLHKIGLVPEITGAAYAYTGVITVIVIVGLLVVGVISLLRRKAYGKDLLQDISPVWWIVAAGALLFSMGVPFVWGMDWIYDYLSVLRQFRSVDWFALWFYYIATILSVVIICRLAKRIAPQKIYRQAAVILIPFAVWAIEAQGIAEAWHHRATMGWNNYKFFYSKEEKDWQTFMDEQGYKSSGFQAIILLPYFHVGSEKIWLFRSNWALCVTMKVAFQLQLPLVDANMSRSSWGQTFNQLTISGGPYAYKKLLHEAKDDRPFLLIHFEGEDLTPDERYLCDNAELIGVNNDLVVYALSPGQLAAREKTEWNRLRGTGTTHSPYYYESYDDHHNDRTIFGEGSAMPIVDKDTTLIEIDISTWPAGKLYESSVWFLVNDKNYKNPALQVKLFDTAGQEMQIMYMAGTSSTDNHGMWLRPSLYFTLPEGCGLLQLRLNEKGEDAYYRLDEIMIRAAEDTVIMRDKKGRVMVNNHLLPD